MTGVRRPTTMCLLRAQGPAKLPTGIAGPLVCPGLTAAPSGKCPGVEFCTRIHFGEACP